MLAHQRQASILDRVRRHGGARVADLVRVLGVSDMTIRRDIEVLAERGLVAKVHGGAVAVERRHRRARLRGQVRSASAPEKVAIAAGRGGLVKPGSAVGISAGTTTAALARELVDVPELTVVTNSIPVADVFYHHGRRDQTVVLTGGTRTPSDALVGPVAQEAAARINLDMLFLGVHGMSARAGFTTPNLCRGRHQPGAGRRRAPPRGAGRPHQVGHGRHRHHRRARATPHVLVTDAELPTRRATSCPARSATW